MSESSLPHYELLPTDQVALINKICDQFEEAWRQGESPAIDDYLSEAPESARKALLHELVLIDASYRRIITSALSFSEYYSKYVGLDEAWLAEKMTAAASTNANTRMKGQFPKLSRYELIGEIGRGGMGIVYQARDRRLGRRVCLKSLHPEMSQHQDRLARFRREAKIVSSLNHPNICTIFELEECDVHPCLVLEWIEGHTFREYCGKQNDPASITDLIAQVAMALNAAHAAGVIHRDLKPENLMVRSDGVVKVLDFGLARLAESHQPSSSCDETRTAEGAMLGTAKYMSPEQARGETATAASDIFSLGIVFYELLAGRHPFPGAFLAAILNAIVESDPTPGLTGHPALHPRLNELVCGMLEKQPQHRPTAAEVAEALRSICMETNSEQGELINIVTEKARTVVGRESELRDLWRAYAEAEAGRGSAIFISGEPGIGKTTLLESFVDSVARRKGVSLLHGRCSQRLSSSDAYLPVLDALARCLNGPCGSSAAQTLQSHAPAWDALTTSSTDALSRLSTDGGHLSQGRLKREFRAFLGTLADRQPIVLFIDDLHWSDESTIDLLSYLGQDLSELRLLILGGYRPTDSAVGNQPFEQFRRDLATRGRSHEVALPFLNREGVALYLERVFPAHRFPETFANLLYERTEGSPLFVDGLVRLLRDRDVITRADEQWVVAEKPLALGHDLPASISNLIDATLVQLSDEDRRLLQAASVQGVEFAAAVVADALQLDRVVVEERLQEIEQVHGLIRTTGEAEFKDGTLTLRHAFVHVLYQEALFSDITPARRTAWSLEIARVLTELHNKRTQPIALELAFLYETGRNFAQAIECLLQSAHQDVMIGANREAAETCRRGLRLVEKLPPSEERDQTELKLQFTRGFAETYVRGFGSRQSLLAYHRAEELGARLPPTEAQFSILHGLWTYYSARMDAKHVASLEERILQLADQLALPRYQYAAHTTCVLSLMHLGNLTLADQHLKLAVNNGNYSVEDDRHFIEQMCMPFGPAFHTARSWLRQLQGHEEEALAETAAAVAWEKQLGVPQFQVSSWYATLYYLQHNAAEALPWSRKAVEFARRNDFDHYLDMAIMIEAWAVAIDRDDDLSQRESLVDAVLKATSDRSEHGSRFGSPLELCMLGEALASIGRYSDALAKFTDALKSGRETGVRWWEAETLRQLGLLHKQGFGDLVEANALFREAAELAKSQGATLLEQRSLTELSRLK